MPPKPKLLGSREPRICVIPDGDEHPKWKQVLELLEKLGFELDPWQLDVLYASMLVRGKYWAAFTIAVCCPRQNGKNEILEARQFIGAMILMEMLQIHSAHLADTCMEAFMRWDDRIDANDDWILDDIAYVRRTNGREQIEFSGGQRIRFRTRTRGGGRGFAGSPVYFDEPMFLPVISQNAILPVLSAQPNPQVWYTGSAVDELEHLDGLVFAEVRERALEGEDNRLAYFEWSVDAPAPDEIDESVLNDPKVWAETNPAFGIRITPEYIKAEQQELTQRGFAVERLGVGAWPETDLNAGAVIDLETWGECGDKHAEISGPVTLSYDVSPERRTAIAICGEAGVKLCVELLDSRAGTGWVGERIGKICDELEVVELVCDGFGPANAIASHVEDRTGRTVRRLKSGEYADACETFANEVEENQLVHLEDEELTKSVRGARTRPLVDRWAWSRSKSKTDPGPVIASSLALRSAIDCDIANHQELVIY